MSGKERRGREGGGLKHMYFYKHYVLCEAHAGQLKQGLRELGVKDVEKEVYLGDTTEMANCWCCLRKSDPVEVFLVGKGR
jgi:hypothetical protein